MACNPSQLDTRLALLAEADPRLDTNRVRVLSTPDGPAVLVGVAHDHPASVYRAERLVDELDPAVVALELPDLLLPVFDAAESGPTVEGGEMAAALAAAGDSRAVGIDVPNPGSLRVLLDELRRRRASKATIRKTLRGTAGLVKQTLFGRLSLVYAPAMTAAGGVGWTQSYDCTATDPPAAQASHECAHLRRSRAFLDAFEAPPATRVLDAARERYMAARVSALAGEGLVVAVVGYSHLDAVAAAIADD